MVSLVKGKVAVSPGSDRANSSAASASEAEHRLFEQLFEDYNEIIRPVLNVSDPVIIQFEVSMSQLVKVVSAGVTSCGHGEWGFWKSLSQNQPCFCNSHVNFNLSV